MVQKDTSVLEVKKVILDVQDLEDTGDLEEEWDLKDQTVVLVQE